MKKILAFVLTISMVWAFFLPSSISFAGDIDSSALETFLEQLSKVSSETREAGASVLRVYLKDEKNGISDLKRDLGKFMTEDYIKIMEDKGYTLNDVKNELDELDSWSIDDRMKLVDYLKDGNNAGIKNLIRDVENKPNDKPNNKPDNDNTTPSTGGGGNTQAPKEDKETKKEEKLLEVNFKDIDKHKNKEDIIFLAERGIIEGKTKEKFDPDGELTRAEFVTLIHRVLGLEPNKDTTLPFKDVKPNSWYYEYVKAAFDNKIIEGTSPTKFSPDDKVSREQMVVIVMRILDNKEPNLTLKSVDKDLAMFEDSGQVSNWAATHMFNGVKYGIIEGRTDTSLNPKEPATRGEAANIIRKLYSILEEEGEK